MKKCKYCKSEIDKDAKICPYCRKNQPIKAPGCLIAFIIVFVFFGVLSIAINVDEDRKQYNTEKEYSVGETIKCPNFEITLNKFEIKEEGTAIDDYKQIYDSEWIGVTLKVKNISNEEKQFYNSNVELINSNGEKIKHSGLTYKIWGSEQLDSPTLSPNGEKIGYIQFANNNKDNSNLKLQVTCGYNIMTDDIVYTYNLKQ